MFESISVTAIRFSVFAFSASIPTPDDARILCPTKNRAPTIFAESPV